jgi:integrase/recombinase XerD
MQIRVEQGKGKKDRYTLLSQKTLEILRLYIKDSRPHLYLFEGQDSSKESLYPPKEVFKIYYGTPWIKKIKKKVTVHTLRHSFPTSFRTWNGFKIYSRFVRSRKS